MNPSKIFRVPLKYMTKKYRIAGRIDNIANNLEQTSMNFKEFSEDIKRNPWKLLMKK